LICSVNLVQGQIKISKPIVLSTGEILKSDTSKVTIPISYIRDANAKLIERNYLIKINAEQDSVIKLNKLYAKEQDVIIKDFQLRLYESNMYNSQLEKDIIKQRNKTKILTGVSGVSILVVIISLFVK